MMDSSTDILHNVVFGIYTIALLTQRAMRFILVVRFGHKLRRIDTTEQEVLAMADKVLGNVVSGFSKWFLGLLTVVSPKIAEEVKTFIKSLEEKAAATPNQWDDMLVGVLKAIFGVK